MVDMENETVEEIFNEIEIIQEDGIYSLWYDNGEKWQEGAYLNGERDGTWVTWNANGKKRNETVYNNGEFVTKKEY